MNKIGKREDAFDTVIFPIIEVIVILLPIFNTAFQAELEVSSIALNWRLLFSAITGAITGALLDIFKRVVDKYKKKKDTEMLEVNHNLDTKMLERDITERDIMLNSRKYNEKWIIDNSSIEDLEQLILEKKALEINKPK